MRQRARHKMRARARVWARHAPCVIVLPGAAASRPLVQACGWLFVHRPAGKKPKNMWFRQSRDGSSVPSGAARRLVDAATKASAAAGAVAAQGRLGGCRQLVMRGLLRAACSWRWLQDWVTGRLAAAARPLNAALAAGVGPAGGSTCAPAAQQLRLLGGCRRVRRTAGRGHTPQPCGTG
jgi:hypothetical protein